MAKRLTDVNIWEEDWFLSLSPEYKLVFLYIKDRCDAGGVWKPNVKMIRMMLDKEIRLNGFLTAVNADKERIKVLPNGRWFLPGFFAFQYGRKISVSSAVHLSAIKLQLIHGIRPEENLSVCQKDLTKWVSESLPPLSTRQLTDLQSFIRDTLSIGLNIYSIVEEEGYIGDKGTGSREEVFTLEEEVIQNTREKKNESDESPEILAAPPVEPERPKPNPGLAYNPPPPDPPKRTIPLDTTPGWIPKLDAPPDPDKPPAPRPYEREDGYVFPWNDDEFRNLWRHWKDHLWQKGGCNWTGYKYRSVQSQQMALKTLSDLSFGRRDLAIKIIEHSITGGYANLHKPVDDARPKSNPANRAEERSPGAEFIDAINRVDDLYRDFVHPDERQ